MGSVYEVEGGALPRQPLKVLDLPEDDVEPAPPRGQVLPP
jgi:hypothetical protein